MVLAVPFQSCVPLEMNAFIGDGGRESVLQRGNGSCKTGSQKDLSEGRFGTFVKKDWKQPKHGVDSLSRVSTS